MIEIVFRMRDWHSVDGTLDNTGATERVGGDEALAASAGRLREAGWAAAARHPSRRPEWGWPPEDDELAVTLDRTDWELVVHELRRWAEITALRSGDDARDEAATQRRVAQLIERRLDGGAASTQPAPSGGSTGPAPSTEPAS
ncbi:hypothetical protein V5D56_14535 [Cellulosimicrobium sp. PMB13]|uniref:hypothetical protein n=1 Tax=Cellulosimicrobium sp. PMB13 TaxID=3120158 RepID=UPI003F4B0119